VPVFKDVVERIIALNHVFDTLPADAAIQVLGDTFPPAVDLYQRESIPLAQSFDLLLVGHKYSLGIVQK
jgi:hypothetical protein